MLERRPDGGDNWAIWQERAERARSRAEEISATNKGYKRRILKLAKRYEQMASMAERAALKKELEQRVHHGIGTALWP